MTNGGVDRSVECTGSIQAMISAFECVHDVSIYPSLQCLCSTASHADLKFNIATYFFFWSKQGWGVAVIVGVPKKDDEFKTHPMNFLNERTLKGTFYGNYKPRTDLPGVVEKYMNKVTSHFFLALHSSNQLHEGFDIWVLR